MWPFKKSEPETKNVGYTCFSCLHTVVITYKNGGVERIENPRYISSSAMVKVLVEDGFLRIFPVGSDLKDINIAIDEILRYEIFVNWRGER